MSEYFCDLFVEPKNEYTNESVLNQIGQAYYTSQKEVRKADGVHKLVRIEKNELDFLCRSAHADPRLDFVVWKKAGDEYKRFKNYGKVQNPARKEAHVLIQKARRIRRRNKHTPPILPPAA